MNAITTYTGPHILVTQNSYSYLYFRELFHWKFCKYWSSIVPFSSETIVHCSPVWAEQYRGKIRLFFRYSLSLFTQAVNFVTFIVILDKWQDLQLKTAKKRIMTTSFLATQSTGLSIEFTPSKSNSANSPTEKGLS